MENILLLNINSPNKSLKTLNGTGEIDHGNSVRTNRDAHSLQINVLALILDLALQHLLMYVT